MLQENTHKDCATFFSYLNGICMKNKGCQANEDEIWKIYSLNWEWRLSESLTLISMKVKENRQAKLC